MGWDTFSDKIFVPRSTKYVDPGTCLTWKNHSDQTSIYFLPQCCGRTSCSYWLFQ